MVYYVLALLELINHYVFEERSSNSDDDADSSTSTSTPAWKRLHRVQHLAYVFAIRAPFHILCFLFAAGAMTMMSLILVWAVIGAVINPFVFLPYAVGAATLVFVGSFQSRTYWALREVNEKRVKTLIASRIKTLLQAQRHFSTAQRKEREAVLDSDDPEAVLDRRSKQELSKLLEEGGLARDDVDILGLAQGKPSAVNMLAVELGVDANVLMLIVSLARRDQDGMLEAAAELSKELTRHARMFSACLFGDAAKNKKTEMK